MAQGPGDHRARSTLGAWGIALIVFSLLLLASNLGGVPLNEVTRLWPLILVAVGLYLVLRPRGRSSEETQDGSDPS